MVFLGMLFVIDLRMLGLIFPNVRASTIADRLDRPMMIGFAMMVISGLLLYYAIPVRTTQSIWFRIKVVLLVLAINAFAFRARMRTLADSWDLDAKPPRAHSLRCRCFNRPVGGRRAGNRQNHRLRLV